MWILLLVIALISALLFIPSGVKITYNDGKIKAHLILFFLNFLIYDSEKPKKQKKSKKNPPKKSLANPPEKKKKKFDFNLIKSLIKGSAKALAVFFKKLRVTKVNLCIAVGGDDPYKVGMTFGMLNAAAYPILGFLDTVEHIKLKHVSIYPDFMNEKTRIYTSFKAKISPVYILKMLAIVGIELIKNKSTENGGNNNGKSVNSGNSRNLNGEITRTR